MTLPYSAVDIVNLMSASLAEQPIRRPGSILSRLVFLVALVELTALWAGAGALASLT